MADYYAPEYVGGPDGTQNPPKKLDGRLVGAKKRRNRATKPAILLNVGDRVYLGKLPAGSSLRHISCNTDTSFGTATVSVGTAVNPTRFANATTVTNTNVPTSIGPKASAAAGDPRTVDEDVWLYVGVASIPASTVAVFDIEYTIST